MLNRQKNNNIILIEIKLNLHYVKSDIQYETYNQKKLISKRVFTKRLSLLINE